MQFLIGDITVKRIRHFVMCLAAVLIFVTAGCVTAPKLTPEDRKRDIQFLADWTRNYNPFVELNEKYKNSPSYETLLPRYLEFAEHAETHEEFYQVVNGYFKVIGASGHFYPLGEEMLKWSKIGSIMGIVKLGITPGQCDRARYWARLSKKNSTRAHPPFHVESREGRYFTGYDWQYEETAIPKGSEILKVNGMSGYGRSLTTYSLLIVWSQAAKL